MLKAGDMDNIGCHLIFVHHEVLAPRLVKTPRGGEGFDGVRGQFESAHLSELMLPLLEAFGHVYLCANSSSCMATILQVQDATMVDLRPTIVLLDTPADEALFNQPARSRSHSPRSTGDDDTRTPDEEVYGLRLLQRIISEAHLRGLSKLVIPIPLISDDQEDDVESVRHGEGSRSMDVSRRMIKKCIELGAIDVIVSPLTAKCVTSLEICIFRAHKEAVHEQQMMMQVRRGRQRSWVGVNEGKPYAYLREAMVSSLMKHICRSGESDDRVSNVQLNVSSERRAEIGVAVGQWSFNAHRFTDDELIIAALIMFKHALDMPELENWRIPSEQMRNFLVACRGAYNNFVPYHNFRHVVDVLQATFHFLVRIGSLAPYTDHSEPERQAPEKSPMVSLLEPFEALTLLITAIGHDVGHPGVNNGFLVTLNAPLAQLYNDRSVLESFHCAAYSQILRRYWPSAFEDTKMRKLMISSILATDMGMHFDYMKKLENTQLKLAENNSTDGWNGRMREEQKSLACSLLIKCADISNVARKHNVALGWMHILADEFARQASMESDLDIPSSLLAQPKKDILALSKSQLSFMNMFAIPLFQGVTDIMPAMQYTIDELEVNRGLFEAKIREEGRLEPHSYGLHDATPSPRTRSIICPDDVTSDSRSHQSLPSRPSSQDHSGSNDTVRPRNDPDFGDPYRTGGNMDGTSSSGQQRRSETTDGSNSGPYSGEWASQATSATTGQMPLSPSTQNTSIVSRDSLDQQQQQQHLGVPGLSGFDFDQRANSRPVSRSDDGSQLPAGDDDSHLSAGARGDGRRLLKKKSSRFLNAFSLFKRNKSSSPSLPTADATS